MRRLEETSKQDLSLDEITTVVDNPRLWLQFTKIVDRAKHGEAVPDNDLKVAMGIVLICIKLKSFSCPGAIASCTVGEYHRATSCKGSHVIKLYEHKTGQQGTAKITIDDQLMGRLQLYFKYIQPLLAEPGHDIDHLFILPRLPKEASLCRNSDFNKGLENRSSLRFSKKWRLFERGNPPAPEVHHLKTMTSLQTMYLC